MAYIGVSPGNGVRKKHTYTADASQTSFTGAGAEGVTLSYKDSNFVDVYQNGVKLAEADYTSTSGTTVVLAQAAAADDIVEIIVYDVFSVADTVSKADGGTFDGNVAFAGNLSIGSTAITSTAAELNILDGVTSTATELNLLDGVTSTTAELNILDGVTSTAAELNILDGVTSTAAELNILDGVTSTAAELNILDGVTSTFTELNLLDGVTATTAELNILDGVTSTATELNLLDGVTATTAELNILDGVTSTAAELNALDGITAVVGELNALDIGSTAVGTAVASKAVILDSSKDYTGIRNLTISGELDADSLDIEGNADINGTLEADAITVNGIALDEFIEDTVGAMVSSNTESGITVAYQDGDGTIDFTVGTLNQDTTGSAATLTTARTIGGVSFDGSANINLPGVNTAGNQNTSGSAATLTNARTIGGVSFNGSANINLPGVNSGGNQATSGNAATATKLATARTINGTNFDGSANITISAGKVLQVVESTTATTVSTSSTTFVTCHEVTITPSASNSAIFITTSMSYNLGGANTTGVFNFRLQRGTTTLSDTSATRDSGSIKRNASEFVRLDEPNTTSATTYRIQIRRTSGSDSLNYCEGSERSTMVAMEIAG